MEESWREDVNIQTSGQVVQQEECTVYFVPRRLGVNFAGGCEHRPKCPIRAQVYLHTQTCLTLRDAHIKLGKSGLLQPKVLFFDS